MKFPTLHVAACLLTAVVWTSSGCTVAPVKQVEIKPAIAIRADAATKPAQLKKVITKIAVGESLGKVYFGWACLPAAELNWRGGKLSISDEEFTDVFRRELEQANYSIVAETNSVFDENSENNADILIGAVINKLQSNLCFPFSGSPNLSTGNVNSVKGGTHINVTWEIYSRAEKKVIYKTTTDGSTQTDGIVSGGYRGIWLRAFSANVKNLLADPVFNKHMLK